jgi:hypothetical protein
MKKRLQKWQLAFTFIYIQLMIESGKNEVSLTDTIDVLLSRVPQIIKLQDGLKQRETETWKLVSIPCCTSLTARA